MHWNEYWTDIWNEYWTECWTDAEAETPILWPPDAKG